MIHHLLHHLITLGIVLLFMLPIDMDFPMLGLFVSLPLIRKLLTSLFGKMPCWLNSLLYNARVPGRLFRCLMVSIPSPASGYTRLRPKLMALLRGTKLA